VIAAVQALPPDQRAAIVLRYYLDLSEAEMAERLDCPPGTVKWRLHAARQRLRTLLPTWLQPSQAPTTDIRVKATPTTPPPKEGGRL
jgi:RNA polymerase sigma-70 factor (ECF subfamily)